MILTTLRSGSKRQDSRGGNLRLNLYSISCKVTTIESLTISTRNIHDDFFLKIGNCCAKGIATKAHNSGYQGSNYCTLLIGWLKFYLKLAWEGKKLSSALRRLLAKLLESVANEKHFEHSG